jgi:uncharacterized protein YndB with AHSA1/START domain
MAEVTEKCTSFSRLGGRIRAVLRRRFEHPPAQVWAMLTDPMLLPQWLAPGAIELAVGGAARLDFGDSGVVIDSTVSALQEGRLLQYAWSGPGDPVRPLRWELAPEGAGTRLTLTLSVPDTEDAGRACAGFEAHLEMLAAALEGVPIRFPFETFKAARDAYRAELAATPA